MYYAVDSLLGEVADAYLLWSFETTLNRRLENILYGTMLY